MSARKCFAFAHLMHEHLLATIVRRKEAEALEHIEPFAHAFARVVAILA